MLRAYTDNTEYQDRTVDNNVASPLFLNGWNFQRGNYYNDGSNTGVGFRIRHNSNFENYTIYQMAMLADDDWSAQFSPLDVGRAIAGDWAENSSVTIYFDLDDRYPPSDSRWVDKITVESSKELPGYWELYD